MASTQSTITGTPRADASGNTFDRDQLAAAYREVRGRTEALCSPLAVEDYVAQSMPDCSPAKWHLAHTSWFFETFLLTPHLAHYQPFDPQFGYLFNSYYNAVGERWARPERGLLTRPTVAEVYRYRHAVDERMLQLLEQADEQRLRPWGANVVLGLNHEQQHQELLLTDVKHLFGRNPLHPTYRQRQLPEVARSVPLRWVPFAAGLHGIGHDGNGFAFDNESPRHRVYLPSFELASRLVTNGEYLAFMEDDGYRRPEFWLSDGWNARNVYQWQAPLYWEEQGGRWRSHTLAGMREVHEAEPVCHVSYYEADAFARWSGARLATEAEWEVAAQGVTAEGNLLESDYLHPVGVGESAAVTGLRQMLGDVWEWTGSAYLPYPGYQPAAGALGEYNGKFMCNQMVLRGGSCVTPRSHIRRTYRNFFPPEARWQFTGIRLARDVKA